MKDENLSHPLEVHPFPPFVPSEARCLIMGTFPPQPKRWSMQFYYPNRTNDFWPMMALIFFGDRTALNEPGKKTFNLAAIKSLLEEKGIAMSDTGYKIRRLADNASDKFLEIVEPVPFKGLFSLPQMSTCRTIGTTGEKAASVIAELTGSVAPKMGEFVTTPSGITHWRLPSTSRAYPLALEKKADYYKYMFESINLL